MDAPTPPPPPDPVATAKAQTESNRETAVANANLNRFNQYTPQGSTEYSVVGTNSDGTPKYESRQTYSPEEQRIYDLNTKARQNLGQIGVDTSARMGALLGTDFDAGKATADKLYELGSSRLAPRFQQQRATLEQQLADKGIAVGTTAYQRAINQFGQTENDAYNQLALTGQQQAFQQAISERNQPINEVTALMSGSQVSNPTYGAVPQATQANTDVAGIYNQAYQNQMAGYNAQLNSNNAMMGGIFGLAGSAMKLLPWSDRRLKKNVVLVCYDANGLGVYDWDYVFGGARHRGYMADEVEALYPNAVHEQYGFKALDYASIP